MSCVTVLWLCVTQRQTDSYDPASNIRHASVHVTPTSIPEPQLCYDAFAVISHQDVYGHVSCLVSCTLEFVVFAIAGCTRVLVLDACKHNEFSLLYSSVADAKFACAFTCHCMFLLSFCVCACFVNSPSGLILSCCFALLCFAMRHLQNALSACNPATWCFYIQSNI